MSTLTSRVWPTMYKLCCNIEFCLDYVLTTWDTPPRVWGSFFCRLRFGFVKPIIVIDGTSHPLGGGYSGNVGCKGYNPYMGATNMLHHTEVCTTYTIP